MQIFQFHLLALPICRPVAGYFDSDFHTQSMWSLSLNRNLIKVAGSRRQILQAQLSNIGRYMGSVVLFRPAEHFFVQFQSLNAACQPLDLNRPGDHFRCHFRQGTWNLMTIYLLY